MRVKFHHCHMYEVRAGAPKFNTSVPEQAVIFTDFFFVCTNLVLVPCSLVCTFGFLVKQAGNVRQKSKKKAGSGFRVDPAMLTSAPLSDREPVSPEREKYQAPPERKRDRKPETFDTLDEALRCELFGTPKVYIDVAGVDSQDEGASRSVSTRSDASAEERREDPDYEPDITNELEQTTASNTEPATSTEPTTPSTTDTEGTSSCLHR